MRSITSDFRTRISSAVVLTATLALPGGLFAQGVPKFEVAASPIQLEGPARSGIYLGGVGRKAAFFGHETGDFEAWSWPVKLLHEFQLGFQIPDYDEPIPGSSVAAQVIVRPELMTVVYSHATFTVRQHFLVPLHEPGMIVLLDVSAVKPLEIVASFKADLDLMWPAGIGGQYAFYDEGNRRFILSESRREYNAYVGSPFATSGTTHPAHAAPDAPSVFRIAIDTTQTRSQFIPIVIAGGIMPRDSVSALYERLIANAEDYYDERVEHARWLREDLISIDSPDDMLDLALEWAKVNLDESLACNPDLGCGMVAGYGPSGRGRRPGFGWYFGGDASINILGILPTGHFELARAGLDFQRRNRRDDGKMPHEVTQSAMRTRENWYSDFPYAYYHADTTPYWVAALWHYWRQTGDVEYVRENWEAVVDAFRWGLANDSDGDKIVDNTAGGLGAVEVGAIGAGLHQDIYLASVWIESLRATTELAKAVGDQRTESEAGRTFTTAIRNLEREYYIEEDSLYAFGILEGGRTNPTVTIWPATALSFSLLDRERTDRYLDALASQRLLTDWGARMLDSDNPLYDPLQYNMGTVWGFVTGFAGWALYNYGRPHAGFAALWANARSTFQFALGRNPELMSGAYFRTLDTTVPHQFFATSMIPTPLLRGLLGLSTNAAENFVDFAPQLPADWHSVTVSNYPVGRNRLNIVLRRSQADTSDIDLSEITAHIRRTGDGPPVRLRFSPVLPVGSTIVMPVDDATEGESVLQVEVLEQGRGKAKTVQVDDEATIFIEYLPGVSVIPRRPLPSIGSVAGDLRIISHRHDSLDWHSILVEGRGGREYTIDLVSPRFPPTRVQGAQLLRISENSYQLRVMIDGPPDNYNKHEIRFYRKPM